MSTPLTDLEAAHAMLNEDRRRMPEWASGGQMWLGLALEFLAIGLSAYFLYFWLKAFNSGLTSLGWLALLLVQLGVHIAAIARERRRSRVRYLDHLAWIEQKAQG